MVPLLKDLRESMQTDLKRLREYKGGKDDLIDAVAFNHALTGLPYSNTGETSDKTGNSAVICSGMSNDNKREIKEVTAEIYIIETVIDKIETSLKYVSSAQKEVLIAKYWESKTWKEIEESMKEKGEFYSNSQVRRMVKRALHKMQIVSMIEIKAYKNVKELVNRNEE